MNEDVTRLLADLVRFESLSGKEADVADHLTGVLEEAGFTVRRLDDNIWCTLGDGDDRLLLNSHLDVVPASDGHPFAPFEPVIREGSLYGRGSVDAKASVACMATALIELAQSGWRPAGGQVVAAFTACEETGWPYNGLNTLRPSLPPIHAALVGEPTELQPCIAQKGLLIVRVEARGRTAHAARAHLGTNAILAAMRDLQTVAAWRPDVEHPVLGKVTVTPTKIEGGTAHNVVPDRCTFTLDIRTTPAYTHRELIDELQGMLESEVHVHSERLVPVDTPADARIVRAVMRALSGAQPEPKPFGSPTLSDWIFLGDIPTVKIGPGRSERSHTPAEHIALDELGRGVDVYKRIIRSYYETR